MALKSRVKKMERENSKLGGAVSVFVANARASRCLGSFPCHMLHLELT